MEIDPNYVEVIRTRLQARRSADSILRWYPYYRFTPNLESIWQVEVTTQWSQGSSVALTT